MYPLKEIMLNHIAEYEKNASGVLGYNLSHLSRRQLDRKLRLSGFDPGEKQRELAQPEIGHKTLDDMI